MIHTPTRNGPLFLLVGIIVVAHLNVFVLRGRFLACFRFFFGLLFLCLVVLGLGLVTVLRLFHILVLIGRRLLFIRLLFNIVFLVGGGGGGLIGRFLGFHIDVLILVLILVLITLGLRISALGIGFGGLLARLLSLLLLCGVGFQILLVLNNGLVVLGAELLLVIVGQVLPATGELAFEIEVLVVLVLLLDLVRLVLAVEFKGIDGLFWLGDTVRLALRKALRGGRSVGSLRKCGAARGLGEVEIGNEGRLPVATLSA